MTRTLQQLEPYLQGHWKFDTDFKDHSQNSNDGTPTAIEWKPTRRGLKPEFNGSSSFINCGNNNSLNVDIITISAWTYNRTDSGLKGIVAKWSDSYTFRFNGDNLQFYIKSGSVAKGPATFTNLPINTWIHVVATYDGDTLRVFSNGIEGTPYSYTGLIDSALTNVIIGSETAGAYRLNGLTDDVRIYSTALTADEVLNLYNSTKHRPGIIPAERSYTHQLGIKPENGLVLGFDGHTKNADGTFQDLSGNSNNGTNNCTSRDVGYFGEVRSFDGVNDYISIVDTLKLSGGHDLTVECWFNTNTVGGSKNFPVPLVMKYFDGNDKDWGLGISNNKLYFGYEYSSNNWDTLTGLEGITTLQTYQWYYATFTYTNSSKSVKIYLDGIQENNDTLPTITPNTLRNVEIGKSGYKNNCFSGSVDEVRIYNRAINATEVAEHFNQIATLPLFHINFKDYPDNEDVSWTDNEPVPYSHMQVGSNGTFKVDDDQLVCAENTSTLTLRNNHEFDGSEYITIDIDGTKYSGTGTITQGTATVSITQGSRFITVAMSDIDVLNSIDIQFRAEVS